MSDQDIIRRVGEWDARHKSEMTKIERDAGGGCSRCGVTPAVNVSGTYWLCGSCVLGIVEKNTAMREAIETYLDWGAKTGSDRDLLEQKFCDAVGRKAAGE